jgi:hypothetical protein
MQNTVKIKSYFKTALRDWHNVVLTFSCDRCNVIAKTNRGVLGGGQDINIRCGERVVLISTAELSSLA